MTTATQQSAGAVQDFIFAGLRGEALAWPFGANEDAQESLLKISDAHDVQPLLYTLSCQTESWKSWPEHVRKQLEQETRHQAVAKLIKKEQCQLVFECLVKSSIEFLLMKGMPLSYGIYPEPHLRPYSDVDIFIQERDLKTIETLMTDLGYVRPNAVAGLFVSHQCVFEKIDEFGVEHVFDFHWKISNPLVFSEALTFGEAFEKSVSVAGWESWVRTLCLEHALFLACVHRLAHHAHEPRWIWLYDIHLLLGGLSFDEVESFLSLVSQKKMSAVCAQGLLEASKNLGSPLSERLLHALECASPDELSAVYAKNERTKLRDLNSNLRALPDFISRVRFMKEYIFPFPEYLLKKYSTQNRSLLPLLYLRRGISGFGKLLKKS